MRIVFDKKALTDIEAIHRWIAYDSPSAARKVVQRLYQSIEGLTLFPDIGRPGTDPGIREWVVTKMPYLVVYEVRETSDELVVLTVFHQAQQRPTTSQLPPSGRY